MKKIFFIIVTTMTLSACKELPAPIEKACTLEFRIIPVQFTDKNGEPRTVKNFKVLNSRTNETMPPGSVVSPRLGMYTVIDDASTSKLSEAGDILLVSALDTVNNQLRTVEFKVKGGKTQCHVEKLSGPDTIRLE